jgi:uncharacterized protein (TIGR03437 family)
MGPENLAANQPAGGLYDTQLAGTIVSFNGTPAPLIYTSATQVGAIVPYETAVGEAQVIVTYQGSVSNTFPIMVAASAPALFSYNGSGAGQAAAVNRDGSLNDASHPVKIGDYVSLYATGEGLTNPLNQDGKVTPLLPPYSQPCLQVSVLVDSQPAALYYAGAAPGEVAGLMQIVIQIPRGVHQGGYVPVVLKVGEASTVAGAAWISVSGGPSN